MGGSEAPIAPAPNHCGKRSWSTTITRMLGRAGAGRRAVRSGRVAGWLGWSPLASASALMPSPAPASAPPAIAPLFRNVRRSTLICCSGSMPSMRALVLGPLLALGLGLAGLTATAAAQSAPTCVPASIDNSALQAGGVTLSPLPGSRDASPRTQISFLGVPVRDLTVQSVIGSRSGAHAGRLAAYSQGDGASFLPTHPFVEGERVTVRARARVGRRAGTRSPTCSASPAPTRSARHRSRSIPAAPPPRNSTSARARTCARRRSRVTANSPGGRARRHLRRALQRAPGRPGR